MWILFLVTLNVLVPQPGNPSVMDFKEEKVTSYDTFMACDRDRIRLVQHAAPMQTYRCGKAEDNALAR